MPENINITCPECQTNYLLPRQNAGKKLRCSKCKSMFTVTDGVTAKDDKEMLQILQEQLKESDKRIKQLHSLNLSYQKEVIGLKKDIEEERERTAVEIAEREAGMQMALTIQIDANNNLRHVNDIFCRYIHEERDNLLGEHFSILQEKMDKSLFTAIRRPAKGERKKQIVKDKNGRIFDVRLSVDQNDMLSVHLIDISQEHQFQQYVQRYIPYDYSNVEEEDLQTFKYPERRFMSISFTNFKNMVELSETMKPGEVRTTMNAYLESIIHAIDVNHATVDKVISHEVLALFGAPRYYKDHALRAIKTACDQMFELRALQISFARFGKKIPDCGIGVNTGDMVVGNMGASSHQEYTVIGNAVQLANQLSRAAKGAEVIITEATLKSALEVLPTNWEIDETTSLIQEASREDTPRDDWQHALPPEVEGKTIAIGPNVKQDPEDYEYFFEYLYALRVDGISKPLPVISVKNKKHSDENVLDDENLVRQEGERFFGKYRLLSVIGRGGMGEVWKAKDTYGNVVALKMLLAGEEATLSQLKRFKREADIMAKLQHSNICKIYEVGEVDRVTYIAMEYIEGVSLSTLLRYRGEGEDEYGNLTRKEDSMELEELIANVQMLYEEEDGVEGELFELESDSGNDQFPDASDFRVSYILPLDQTLKLLGRVCEAVQYAHKYGILHRDLKPGNIMLRPDGSPVVMDFGLAKADDEDSKVGKMKYSLSVSGQVVGTIDYMSPEQALSSKDVNEQTDVYALGALLYQMVTGKKHFKSAGNMIQDAQSLQDHVPVKPSVINKSVEFNLELITMKALQNSPAKRYRSVNSFKFDLNRYSRGHLVAAKSDSQWLVILGLIKRNIALFYVILTAISMMIVLTTWFILKLHNSNVILAQERDKAKNLVASAKEAEERIASQKKKLRVLLSAASLLERAKLIVERDGDYVKAFGILDEAIKKDEKWAEPHYQKGLYQSYLGLYKDARASLITAKANNYHDDETLNRLLDECNDIYDRYSKVANQARTLIQFKKLTFDDVVELGEMEMKVGDWEQAVVHLTQALVLKPDDHNVLILLKEAELRKNNPNMIGDVMFRIDDTTGKMEIDIRDEVIRDLSSLEKMNNSDNKSKKLNIRRLNIFGGTLKSWKGINDLKLHELKLHNTLVESKDDILNNENIKILTMGNTNVETLSNFRNLKLQELNIYDSKISDLAPLKSMPLEKLDIRNSKVSSFYVLPDNYPEDICFDYSQISNLEAIKGGYFTKMTIKGFDGSDFSELRGFRIRHLTFVNGSIPSPELLSYIKGLESVTFDDCVLEDTKGLGNLSMNKMSFENSYIRDLNFLATIKVRVLDFDNANVKDVRIEDPNHYVKKLILDDSNFSDFSFILRFRNLEWLSVRGTSFDDFRNINDLPLNYFSMNLSRRKNGYKSIHVLDEHMDIEELYINDVKMEMTNFKDTLKSYSKNRD